jgi:hypothetical protein
LTINNGYATLTQVKAALRIPSADTVDDALLTMAVESASRLIDGHTSRRFYSAGTAVRFFAATDELICEVDDLASENIILQTSANANNIYDITWDVTDYQLEPLNGDLDGLPWPYTKIRAIENYLFPILGKEALVKVTGVFGWPEIPMAVTQACIIQASRIFKRLDSPLGVAGFGDMGAMRVSRDIDPDVAQLLMPYKRMRNFA